MPARSRSNPLALAVLCLLDEKAMHPYEMAQTLRSRAKQDSVRLNYGSLYGVVAGLERRGLVRAVETVREGRRPQRTVYEITDRGATEKYEWLSELVAVPVKEYLQFEAGLSLMGGLAPDDAVQLLRERLERLVVAVDQAESLHESLTKRGLPRVFWVESELVLELQRAELAFTGRLIADIEGGTLPGLEYWHSWQGEGSVTPIQLDAGPHADLPPALGAGDGDGPDRPDRPDGGRDDADADADADADPGEEQVP